MRKVLLSPASDLASVGDVPAINPPSSTTLRQMLSDYAELTKPRITVMALFTVGIGFLLAAGWEFQIAVLLHTLLGAGLVAAGGSALNHFLERDADARMLRTQRRPLPMARITPEEAFLFGLVLGTSGFVYLLVFVPEPAAAIFAALTFLLYICVYTPLKRQTIWNTLVGAIPGALPPLIGWSAVKGFSQLDQAFPLFLILFLWQIPHFLSIAWMYREDYGRGGLRMLPLVDHCGLWTTLTMTLTTIGLVAASLWPGLSYAPSPYYVAGVLGCGALFLFRVIQFGMHRSDESARSVLRASLLYLPAVLGLLLWDRFSI